MQQIIISLLFFGFFYFFFMKPQAKKAKEKQLFLANLAPKQQAVLLDSILGEVVSIHEEYVVVKISKDTHINVKKTAFTCALPKGSIKFHA